MTGERQKTVQLCLAFPEEGRGEAPRASGGGTEPVVASRETESPAETERMMMEEVCQRENLFKALSRVQANRGSPGVDGMTVEELPDYLREHWPAIREQLMAGTYKPQPVKRVEIPKPGGGVRKLGIPTVLDRLIQQAVLQVLQPRWDPTFSEHSYGFRPGRSARQAVAAAQAYIAEGYRWVVDIDLEKFFDQVCHDRLMAKAADRIADKRLLKLLRAYLNAGVLENGLVQPSNTGTPQGGPLSPLLSNLVLDELDRELERRGHRFVRYADDGQIFVRSERAGHRVMTSLTKYITKKLRLKVNEAKSAVAQPWERKYLGFSFTWHPSPKRRLAPETVRRLRRRVRKLTRRTQGVSIEQMVEDLNRYLIGWRGYFGYCETPSVLERQDKWIRRRLRAVYWKQWKHGRRRYTGLRARGVGHYTAATTAWSSDGPWHLARCPALQHAFPNAYWDSMGLARLAARTRA